MKTMTLQTRYRSVALAVAVACVAALPVHAESSTVTVQTEQQTTKPKSASKQESIGIVTGLAVGAAAGGPIGAVIGAAVGAWTGDHYHKQVLARDEAEQGLTQSEMERTRLAQNVTELNGSLAQTQERGEQLDLALSHTDEVQTDVGFRTNDDSIQTQSLSPLMKLGALAAALPDAKVRVDGYADPRGSTAVNAALSKRRADAVAAVLASAGVAPDRIVVEAHGKSDATSTDGDMDGYAFDRRVTVRIERSTQEASQPAQAVAKNQ
jgi:outer membrane protein OmpA-like peptidoglycan-associated protein